MKPWRVLLLVLLLCAAVLVTPGALAQDYDPSATGITNNNCAWGFLEVPFPGFQGKTICEFINTACPLRSYAALLANFFIAAIVGVGLIMIVLGGYVYMTAGGNATRVGTAKTMIGTALIGIILALATILIIRTVNPDILSGACPISGAPGSGEDDTYHAQIVSPSSHSRASSTVVEGNNLPVQVDVRVPNGDPATSVQFIVDENVAGEQVLGITDSVPVEEPVEVSAPQVLGVSTLGFPIDTSGLAPGIHILKVIVTTESGLTITQEVEFEVVDSSNIPECIDGSDNDGDGLTDCGYETPDDLPAPHYYDVNSDGVVSEDDIVAIQDFLSGNAPELPTGSLWQNPDNPFDVNGDLVVQDTGPLASNDVLLIQDHIDRHESAYGDTAFPEPGDPQCYGQFQAIPNPLACDPTIELEKLPTNPAAEIEVTGGGFTIGSGDDTPDVNDGTDFGDVVQNVDPAPTRTFTIQNLGEEDLFLRPVAPIQITGDSSFSVTTQPSSTLEAGESADFVIEFSSAGSGGNKTATVTIENNDSDENPYTFDVAANRVAPPEPEMNVFFQDTGIEIPSGDTNPTGPTGKGTNFGGYTIGNPPIVRTFSVVNTGNDILGFVPDPDIVNVTNETGPVSGAFTVASFTTPTVPSTVLPSETGTLTLHFAPSTVGNYSATISMTNTDPDENPYTFAIEGAAVGTPDIEIAGSQPPAFPNPAVIPAGDTSPSDHNGTFFPNARAGSGTATHTFVITNTGTDSVSLDGTPLVNLVGGDTADFTVSAQPAATSLAPGETTSFDVTFAPTKTGLLLTQVSVDTNVSGKDPYTFDIAGVGTGSEAEIQGNGLEILNGDDSPRTADGTNFGTALLGSGTVVNSFEIHNRGDATLRLGPSPYITFSGAGAAAFSAAPPVPLNILASGSPATFSITFNPESLGPGTYPATVSIPNDDADENPYIFDIIGTASGVPEIEVEGNGLSITDGDTTPDTADDTQFGTVDVGANDTHTFTVRNTGSDALVISGAVSTTGSNDFQVTQQPTSPVPAGGSATFQVRFSPSSTGAQSAIVTIESDDADEGTYTFAVEGAGQAPEMAVLGINGSEIADGSTAIDTTLGTDFGQADVGTTTAAHTFTIENTGNKALDLTGSPSIAIDGDSADFTVTAFPSSPVGSGTTTQFSITFNPTTPGTRTAAVRIENSDADEAPYNFVIEGTGYQPEPEFDLLGAGNTPIANGDFNPDTADGTDFGNVAAGTTSTPTTFTIQNTGDAPLDLTGLPSPLSLIGSINDFTVDTTSLDTTIAPGAQTTFTIAFSPQTGAQGSRQLVISILNSDATGNENPYEFIVEGNAFVPESEMEVQGNGQVILDGDGTPRSADRTKFGGIAIGDTSAASTFTIHNTITGTKDLILTGGPHVTLSGPHASDFTVVTQPTSPITVGASTPFSITFTPSAASVRSATISIANDDSDKNPYDFAIEGTGLAPEIDVEGNGTSIQSGDTTPDTNDDTEYGTVVTGEGGTTHTFTVQNEGTQALQLTDTPTVSLSSTEDTTGLLGHWKLDETTLGTCPGGDDACDVSGNGHHGNHVEGPTISTDTPSLIFQNDAALDFDGVDDYVDIPHSPGLTPSSAISVSAWVKDNIGSSNGRMIHKYEPLTPFRGYALDVGEISVCGTNKYAFWAGNLTPTGANGSDWLCSTSTIGSNTWKHIVGTNDGTTSRIYVDGVLENSKAAIPSLGNSERLRFGYDNNTHNTWFTGTLDDIRIYDRALSPSEIQRLASGAPMSDFYISRLPTSPITAGGSQNLDIVFDPVSAGTHSTTVTITNDDSDENPYTFTVRGTAELPPPDIAVSGNGTGITNGDTSPSTTDGTQFGTLAVSSAQPPQVTDDAPSNAPFTVTGNWTYAAPPTGGGYIQGEAYFEDHHFPNLAGAGDVARWSFDVVPGASYQVATTWRPHSNRATNATYYLKDGNPANVVLTQANQKVAPSHYSWDDQDWHTLGLYTPTTTDLDVELINAPGTNGFVIADAVRIVQTSSPTEPTETQSFTVSNEGGLDLNLTGSPRVAVTGSHAADFTIVSAQPPAQLTEGATTSFDIQFDPQGEGQRDATITISNNDPDEAPFSFAVSGCGGSCTTPPTPPTNSLFVNGTGFATVQQDESFTLNWTSTNATGCDAIPYPLGTETNFWTGTKSANGTQTPTIGPSGLYILQVECFGAGGRATPDWVTINVLPPTPTVGDSSIFVTNSSSGRWAGGQVGGLTNADQICQNEAANPHSGNPVPHAHLYKALLSDSTEDARDRVTIAGRLFNMAGTPQKVADNEADLWDGTLDNQIRYTTFGGNAHHESWTGSGFGGRGLSLDRTCNDWTTSSSAVLGKIGRNQNTNALWISEDDVTCNSPKPLYCVGPWGEAGAPGSSVIFATSSLYRGHEIGGIAGPNGANSKCVTHAQNAGLSNAGQYKAVLSDSNTDAKDNIASVPAGPVVNVNNDLVAASQDHLWQGSLLNPIQYDETGSALGPSPADDVWTGTDSDGLRDSGSFCANWNTPSSEQAEYGRAYSTDGQWISSQGENPGAFACSAGVFPIYCIGPQ